MTGISQRWCGIAHLQTDPDHRRTRTTFCPLATALPAFSSSEKTRLCNAVPASPSGRSRACWIECVEQEGDLADGDQHYEDHTNRNFPLQDAELQRWCDLSSCTLAHLPRFERCQPALVEVTATSAVWVFFLDEPCFNLLNQRPALFGRIPGQSK